MAPSDTVLHSGTGVTCILPVDGASVYPTTPEGSEVISLLFYFELAPHMQNELTTSWLVARPFRQYACGPYHQICFEALVKGLCFII